MQSDISIEQVQHDDRDGVNDGDGKTVESAGDEIESSASADDLPLWSPRIVHIRAMVRQLDDPVVPFVVLKNDPRLGMSFEQESQRIYSGQPHSLDSLRTWWNAPLRALSPERRYFLLAWSAIEGAPPRVVPVAGLTFGIATPGPSFKRWITTDAMTCRGELVAWCEEIDMTGIQEDIIEIVLSEERMLRLMSGQAAERVSKVA